METDLRIGYFTAQPSSIDPFHGFDPDSYTAITACHDSLTCIGVDGELTPGLAKEWRRIDPVTMEFTLREGVLFHNGEKLNSDAVVATIAAQRDPANHSPTGQGILGSIQKAEKVDEYRFRLITEFPDAMLLWRLAMFSDIVPPEALARHGVHGFKDHPIGTGPFMFHSMEHGKYIRYVRNPNYWRGAPKIESFRFVIMPAPNWVEALSENKLDLVYGLHSVQAPLLEKNKDIQLTSRLVALSHWFLLSQNGPLADVRVRQAMNYAVDNYMLAKIQGQDKSIPQRCVGTAGQFGFNEHTPIFPFNPDKAKELLAEAGYASGFTLKGMVADHSASLVQMIAAYLADVKIQLEYEVVPRTVWMDRVPNARMSGQGRFAGDFAVAPVDNPIMYSGFHHYIFLSSMGPFSLLANAEYDKRFMDAMSSIDQGEQKLKELDQYAHDEALLLFTLQTSVLVAARKGVSLQITQSGHFGNVGWLSLEDTRPEEKRPEWQYDYLETTKPIAAEDFRKVLEATQHSSDMFFFSSQNLNDPRLEKIVTNLNYQQQIKLMQDKMRFEQIVQYLNKTRDMEGILNASRFSGIANYNMNGDMVLCNPAFVELFGEETRKKPLRSIFPEARDWDKFTATLHSEGGFFGSLNFLRTNGDILEAQAACSMRKGSAGENIGYLMIIRDESEERKLRVDLERSYRELEDKVVQRTSELSKTLDEVQRLKQIQDGDYFLTTLLLQPLGLNQVESEKFSVEVFSRQKKKFTFKKKTYEIGGDLNIAYTVALREKKYTFIL
ncbi:MAG TPA: ABC transporter substrate-binding protein, partial [Turneriella sp.]|nr:ABC transporter substrate-binding protein [Turneriella sp.]